MYASVWQYEVTVAHVDESDLKSRFDGKILNSDLRSVVRSKSSRAYLAYDVTSATRANSTRPPPLHLEYPTGQR